MDQLDLAIQATAMNAPGGMKGLAQKMGVNHQTLINKCNPNSETHRLTPREVAKVRDEVGEAKAALDALLDTVVTLHKERTVG